MRDDQQGIEFRQTAQVFHKGNVGTIILPRCGLVEQQNFALHRQHRGDSHALLLSKAQRKRRTFIKWRDIQCLFRLLYGSFYAFRGEAQVFWPKTDLFAYRGRE